MNEPAAVESPDATTLDPASARLDTLDYEAYRSERSQPALPGTEPPTDPPATGASAGEPTPAEPTVPDDAPGRDDSGKFTKRQASKHENPVARIQELTAKAKQAEERAAALEREVQEIRQSRQQAQPQPPQTPPETRPKPRIEDFMDQDDPYDARQEALAVWVWEQKEAAKEHAARQREQQDRWNQHLERVNTYRAQQPDWDEVISRPSTPLSGVMMQAIVESQRGPEIAYYLGSHPEVLAQLAAESKDAPSVAAPLMRRYLESVLPNSSPAAGQPTGSALGTRHSRAAAPPTPVGNGSPTARDESPENEPVDAFVHRRNQEELKRRQMYGR